jgi:hypothetical protein
MQDSAFNAVAYFPAEDAGDSHDRLRNIMIEANSVIKDQFTQALCLIAPLHDPTLPKDIAQLSLLAGIDAA